MSTRPISVVDYSSGEEGRSHEIDFYRRELHDIPVDKSLIGKRIYFEYVHEYRGYKRFGKVLRYKRFVVYN